MGATPGIVALHSRAARLLAVGVLLSEPEELSDDVLGSRLYFLRDKLRGNSAATGKQHSPGN
jgi:hypothetical protein